MTHYQAPQITNQRDLNGDLQFKSLDPRSDATIKHGVELVADYQAPEITAERSLDAKLISLSELNDGRD